MSTKRRRQTKRLRLAGTWSPERHNITRKVDRQVTKLTAAFIRLGRASTRAVSTITDTFAALAEAWK